ncbi:CAP domain-containing protein [Paenibacillus sp. strain BS8-2]
MKRKLVLLFFILAISAESYTVNAAPFADVSQHWSNPYIDWALDQGLANGYEDGTFRPDDPISEVEFLALMLRAYGNVTKKDEIPSDWGRSYYQYADSHGWPITFNNDRGRFRRGQAALLIASAVKGVSHSENNAIGWLLETGISKGRTSATVAGYDAAGGVTRAEALTFLYAMKQNVQSLSNQTIPKTQLVNLKGMMIGDSLGELQYRLGKASRIDVSEFDYEWHTYSGKYTEYAMFGVRSGIIVAMFSNDAGSWTYTAGVNVDMTLSAVLSSLPSAAKNSAKQTSHYYEYASSSYKHVLFLDSQENNRVAGIWIQLQSLSPRKSSLFADKERVAMEQQLFDLVNAERAQRSIATLNWDSIAGSTARAHSADMMKNAYFDHTNLNNKTPFDRMKSAGIRYSLASENIAAGYSNSLYAHYALLNSTGHRKTILNAKLERLGTGVAFGGKYQVYFTQNYYTP